MAGLAALSDDVHDDASTKALSEASVAIWRELGDRRGLGHALHTLGWAEAGMGHVGVATALFREALGPARAAGDDRATALVLGSLGDLLAEQGKFVAARPFLEEGMTVARAALDEPEIAETAADLGWLAVELGDTAAARASFTECLHLLRETGRRRVAVFAIEGCAVLAATEGARARATRLMAAASAMRDDMGVPAERDPRLIAAAPTSARQVLRQPVSPDADHGHVWSTEEAIRDALDAVTTPLNREAIWAENPAASFGLTPREADVLHLVVAGRSDRAIADTLFMSRRTASKHVSSILAKLGVASRTEAAARAVRDELL